MKLIFFGMLTILIQISNGFPSDHQSLKDSGRDFEKGYLYQGDMLLTPEQFEEMQTSKSGIEPKNKDKIWPNNIIPYEFDSTGHNEASKAIVKDAMEYIMDKTSRCVTFVKHTNELNYVVIKYNSSICQSAVGKNVAPGPQYLWMSDWSCDMGIVAHELLHTLGFKHEQARFDRDEYVRINFENIEENMKHNFNKEDPTQFTYYGVTYDYDSIMHYGSTDFGKRHPNGTLMETIHVLQKGTPKIGQRDHLSEKNIKMIKNMYKCA